MHFFFYSAICCIITDCSLKLIIDKKVKQLVTDLGHAAGETLQPLPVGSCGKDPVSQCLE